MVNRAIRAVTLAAGLLASAALAEPMALPSDSDARQISVVVDRGITHTNQLPWALRPLRKAMVGGAAMSLADLRKLADRGDSLAALKLVKAMRSGAMPESASDMAFYAAVAAGAGRRGMLGEMIAALYRLTPGTEPAERLSQSIRVLYGHAWAGNTRAQDALVALNGEGRLFGPMSDATREKILTSGGARMVLSLAMTDLARKDLDEGGLMRVRGYLERAERNGDLAIRTMAQTLSAQVEARLAALAVN
ncbi:MAG: hypothetical protein EP318_06455 [Rhodobacteraceae bacterium]|nr:MAG: hypothetical protein EP318_06455 [Paracoccaceae bacterium]